MPKQFLELQGRAILAHTAAAFLASDVIDHLQVVIHPDDRSLYDEAMAGLSDTRIGPPVSGGATRAASVRLGLQAMAWAAPRHVLIHDAARPFVTPEIIGAVDEALLDHPGAFAAIEVVDALWSSDTGMAKSPVPRAGLWRAQTPQGFRYEAILAAHEACDTDAADDVEIARMAGLDVALVPGHEANFKITTPEDLARAKAQWAKPR